MRHLDAVALKEIESGHGPTRAYFAQHLGAACEQCETFLLENTGPGWLDGAVDVALYPESIDARLDEVGYRRIQRSIGPRPERLPRRWFIAVGGIAAALVAAVGLWRNEHYDGMKGAAPTLSVELQPVRQDEAGNIQRLDPDTVVPRSGSLLLRTYSTEVASAWLFKSRGRSIEALGSFELEPGAHTLTLSDGAAAALPLEDETGPLTLVLVAGTGKPGLTVEEARRGAEDPVHTPYATARLTLQVSPEH
jgi:hypothetical protein